MMNGLPWKQRPQFVSIKPDPEYSKSVRYGRWKRAGIKDIERAEELYQNAKQCEICKIFFSKTIRKYRKQIDHDHVTGKTRGALCHRCNSSLGLLEENVIILQAAIDYIRHTNSY